MTSETPPERPEVKITPLYPQQHDRESFGCGIPRLDNFLKRSARKQQAGDFTRVWVATFAGQREIVGYYALNAHRLEADSLPPALTRNAPSHGGIPAIYLSMIAVDLRHQGKGLGKILLADALKRAVSAAGQIGLKAVVLDVIEDGGPKVTGKRIKFYIASGFVPLPDRPLRMIISVETIRRAEDAMR